MGKYTSYSKPKPAPRVTEVHPVMRGIGCIMMIVVPIISYGIAILLVNYGATHGWSIPPGWFGPPTIPQALWNVQGLRPILEFIRAQNNLQANLIFAIAVTVVIGGIMSMIYGFTYSIFGPPKYGPQDEPPIRVKVKRYKR